VTFADEREAGGFKAATLGLVAMLFLWGRRQVSTTPATQSSAPNS